jgi:hypothetical protein
MKQKDYTAMTDQTYWVVHLEVFSFKTKEEADDFRNLAEDALLEMPDSETLTVFSTVKEEQDD